MVRLPDPWAQPLADFLASERWRGLVEVVAQEYDRATVFPPRERLFAALSLTPPEAVRVVILGQDPYHGPGQAHGLAFSVPHGVRPPPSLVNILRERQADLGLPVPPHGCLERWARHGVLLLNTALTVRAGEPGSHHGRGWEAFTDAVLRLLTALPGPRVFILWGNPARRRMPALDPRRHAVIASPHPSPLSAYRGFFGSRPFSSASAALVRLGSDPLDWRLDGE